MNTRSTLLLSLFVLAAPAVAQHEPVPIPGPVRNAGTYHVHSQTWTRGATPGGGGVGSDVIYSNTYFTGYYQPQGPGGLLVDEGRIPIVGGNIAGANRTEYSVDALTLSYCAGGSGGTLGIELRFYESYQPCENPLSPTSCIEQSGVVTVPNPMGSNAAFTSCWIMTVDLEGYEFHLEGDGGACSPGTTTLETDTFGWSVSFTGNFQPISTGMILGGAPSATPSTAGAYQHGGTGTYYDSSMPTGGNTGLDTVDGYYSFDPSVGADGCLSYGPNLFASFQMEIEASVVEGCAGPICETCEPLPHSGGGQAHLTGSLSPVGGLHLECTDGLAGEFCYVLTSTEYGLPGVNAFNGRLCLTGSIARFAPLTASNSGNGAFNSMGSFDAAGVYQNMAGTSSIGSGFDVPLNLPPPITGAARGQTLFYQLWFRDSAAGVVQGLSNVVEVSF